jgi:phenylacetate-CoA ligase
MIGPLLDRCRTAVASMSPQMRSSLAPILRHAPESLKYGNSYRKWRRQLCLLKGDASFVPYYQTRKLQNILCTALTFSDFYRAKFHNLTEKGIDLCYETHQNWNDIPITTGDEVNRFSKEMCVVNHEVLDTAMTGGSSGRPVKFFIDRDRSPIEIAFHHDAWATAGYRVGQARCVLRGFEPIANSPMFWDPALAELRCSVFFSSDEQLEAYVAAIRSRSIRYIHGYPSALASLADFILRSPIGPMKDIDGLFPISERLYGHYRRRFERAFPNARIVATYGLSEKVAFAVERDKSPDVYCFNPLYGYSELVDDHGSVVTRPGAWGRIVSTGLLFTKMPLIRYETGDRAELVELPNASSGYQLVVRNITPKHGTEFFVGHSGALIPLSGALHFGDELLGIREFQFRQTRPGEVVIKMVPSPGAVPRFEAFRARLNRKASGDLTFGVEVTDHLPLSKRGKRKFIDQQLNITDMPSYRLHTSSSDEQKNPA